MKSKILAYTLLAIGVLTFSGVLNYSNRSSGSLRGLQSDNATSSDNETSVATNSLPLTFNINGVSAFIEAINLAINNTNATFDTLTFAWLNQTDNNDTIDAEGQLSATSNQGLTISTIVQGVYDPLTGYLDFNASADNLVIEQASDVGGSDVSDLGSSEASDNNDTSLPTVDANGFTILDIPTAEAIPSVAAAFEWAAQAIIAKGESQNKIPVSEYNVTNWYYAAYKGTTTGTTYKFGADFVGANDVNVQANVTVNFRDSNQSYSLNGYSYRAWNIPVGSLNNTNPANTTNVTTNVTNITSTVYTNLPVATLSSNAEAWAALKFGAGNVLDTLINVGKLPGIYPSYKITSINSAAYANTTNATLYKFSIDSQNAAYIHADLDYIVSYNGTYSVIWYHWLLYNYTLAQFNQTTNTTTTTTNTTAASNSTSSGSTIVTNSTVADNNGTIISSDNTTTTTPAVNVTIATNATNTTTNTTTATNTTTVTNTTTATNTTGNTTSSGSFNTTNTTSNVTSSSYFTALDLTKIYNSTKVVGALNFGAQNVTQTLINQKKIPATPAYNISQVFSAEYRNEARDVLYRFKVQMTNADYVRLNLTYNVTYATSGAYNVQSYKYIAWNYTQAQINASNSVNSTNSTNGTRLL